jgi:hypothetical protein
MRLKMVRAKAAVFPVPDWDWAIMFLGLMFDYDGIKKET